MDLNYDSIEPFKRRSSEVASKASINRHAPKDERSKDEGRGRRVVVGDRWRSPRMLGISTSRDIIGQPDVARPQIQSSCVYTLNLRPNATTGTDAKRRDDAARSNAAFSRSLSNFDWRWIFISQESNKSRINGTNEKILDVPYEGKWYRIGIDRSWTC